MADNIQMDPHGFNENSRLRASDADRDAAATVISDALAEGRLTAAEHAERLDAVYAAKTQGELVPLLSDLPGQVRASVAAGSRRNSRLVAIFGGFTRAGAWHPEPEITTLAIFGGGELDFREAVLPGKEIILRATAVFGGLEITVPPEMRVVDNGIAILGGREITGNRGEAATPEAPVLRIEGAVIFGGISVKRRRRKGDRQGAAGLLGAPPLGDVLGRVLGRREEIRELRDRVRDQHREWHDQMRQQRRDWHRDRHRRHWPDSDD